MGNPSHPPSIYGKSSVAVLYKTRPGEEARRDGLTPYVTSPCSRGGSSVGQEGPLESWGCGQLMYLFHASGGSAQPGPWGGYDQQRL